MIEARGENEKERLGNLMAYGIDPNRIRVENIGSPPPIPKAIDRFDECNTREANFIVFKLISSSLILVLIEIEERNEFLREMTILGKRKEYESQIKNEIAEVSRVEKQKEKLDQVIFHFIREFVSWKISIVNARRFLKNSVKNMITQRKNEARRVLIKKKTATHFLLALFVEKKIIDLLKENRALLSLSLIICTFLFIKNGLIQRGNE